jgi:hypothetical protein
MAKLNKCILIVETIFYLTQEIASHRNVLETVICWTNCILDIFLVLLFKVLNMIFQISEFCFCWPLLVEYIYKTVRDRGNMSTHYHKLSVQSIHRKNCIKIGRKIKNSIQFPNMWNFDPFSDNVTIFLGPINNSWRCLFCKTMHEIGWKMCQKL